MHTVIRNTILDKNVMVEAGATIGGEGGSVARGLTAHQHGITVIGKGSIVDPEAQTSLSPGDLLAGSRPDNRHLILNPQID